MDTAIVLIARIVKLSTTITLYNVSALLLLLTHIRHTSRHQYNTHTASESDFLTTPPVCTAHVCTDWLAAVGTNTRHKGVCAVWYKTNE